jgi:CubicO group peptidase (beta-lactamase class C family)
MDPITAIATVTPRGTEVSVEGADDDADFEIGSISKGVTGLLYADALARGEVRPATTLGELLPLGDVPVAGVTLASLSTHRSGLPRLPKSAQPWRRTFALWRHGTNPYGESLDELLDQARGVVPAASPRPGYSNFGFELLGHAVAAGAGMPYAELVRRRLTEPLGLGACYVPATAAELGPGALVGRSRSGRPREPWTGEAIGPAGGIRATITAMARLTTALLDGSAPGTAALDPVADLSGRVRIGAAWIVLQGKGRSVTWHNGGTGGFRSWLGLDRAAGTGVVVLSATTRSVDRRGFESLAKLG